MAQTQDPIETLKDSVTGYLGQIVDLKKTVEQRDQRILTLETNNASLTAQVEKDRATLKDQSAEITRLKKEIEEAKAKNTTLTEEIGTLKTSLAEQESKSISLQEELSTALKSLDKEKKAEKKASKESKKDA